MRVALGLAAFALLGVVAATASAFAGFIVNGSTLLGGPWIVTGPPHPPSMARVLVFVVAALAIGLAVLRPRVGQRWLAAVCAMPGPAAVGMVALALVLGAVVILVGLDLQHLSRRPGLAVVIGVLVVVLVAPVWLSVGHRATAPRPPTVIPGLPAVGVTLVPLILIVAIGIAMNGKPGIGPLSASQLLWWVIAPLAAIYPGLAAFIAPRSRAEMAVVGVAVAAPAFALAIRAVMDPMTGGCPGCQPDLGREVLGRASLPAFLVVATFLAIEAAAAVMSRPGWPWAVAGVVLGAVTFGASGLLSVIVWSLI